MKVIKADLFEAPVDAIAHGCNAAGVMGAGIAKVFRDRFPKQYFKYSEQCAQGKLNLGNFMPWMENGQIGFNLITQVFPGPTAQASAIGQSLGQAMSYITTNQLPIKTIGIPRIGCGIGGLTWDQVEPMIIAVESIFPSIEIVVCDI